MVSNKRQTLKILSAIFGYVFVTSYLLVNLHVQDDQFRETTGSSERTHVVNVTEYTMKSKVSPPFIYLTQTEQCLTPSLIQTLELNDASRCRCDVIVLSYKNKCLEKSAPHITYLFDNETTWGSGGDKLYFQAMERRLDYLYYVFLDDDITLQFTKAATPEMVRHTPISVFQDWLLEYGPAVGAGDYERPVKSRLRRHDSMQVTCNSKIDNTETTLSHPAILFGPLFNAFHTKVVSHIFPVHIRHENRFWWFTDKYIATFRRQGLIFCPVAVGNLFYRSYETG